MMGWITSYLQSGFATSIAKAMEDTGAELKRFGDRTAESIDMKTREIGQTWKDVGREIGSGGSYVSQTYNLDEYKAKEKAKTDEASAKVKQAKALSEQKALEREQADLQALEEEQRTYRSRYGGRRSLLFNSRLGVTSTLGGQ